MKKILAVNSGSSSFKYKLFSYPDEKVLAQGMGDRVGMAGSTFSIKLADGSQHLKKVAIPDQSTAVKLLIKYLQEYQVVKNLNEIAGVGHRVVNGGEIFKDSALINQTNLQKILDLSDFAPLHNPPEARGIEAFMKNMPGVPQVAVFDTSFHQSMDKIHYLYSIPYVYYQKYEARKFGAHGTSVHFVILEAAKMMHRDLKELKLIVCHLGSGASITAVKNGKSYDTSMGFSPVSGITMSTRSGDVDPSLLQFLMRKMNLSMDEMIDILNHKSGLLGISGISPDMRDLKYNKNPRAILARKIFINRIVRYLGAYLAEMGGADGIIFTAGVGEGDVGVRQQIMNDFKYLGVKPDDAANKINAGAKFITKSDSKIQFMVIPTNEELMIEREVVRLAHLK